MTETHKPSPDSEEPSSPTIGPINNKYQLKDFHAYGSTVGVIHNPEVVLRAYNNGQRTMNLNDRWSFMRRGYSVAVKADPKPVRRYVVGLFKK